MKNKKKPSDREQVHTNIRIDEELYNKLTKYKKKTGYPINTIVKSSIERLINAHLY